MRNSLIFLLCLAGCTTTGYREAADREVSEIIAEKAPAVPGMSAEFTIDRQPLTLLEELPWVVDNAQFLLLEGEAPPRVRQISLEDALEIAVLNSREYQSRKESLYLSVLSLTAERDRWEPRVGAGGSVSYNEVSTEVELARKSARDKVDAMTGSPGDLVRQYGDIVKAASTLMAKASGDTYINTDRSVTGQSQFSVNWLLATGARFGLTFTSNFLRYLSGDPTTDATSLLTATLTQPLLRGAGRKIAQEQLTQAERNVLYQLRDFTRYRKEFAVRTASDYYRVLQQRDTVRNTWQSFQDRKRTGERQYWITQAGRDSEANLGRLRQSELSAENSWVQTRRVYFESLDLFKLRLGLPIDSPVTLKNDELDRLREEGLKHPALEVSDAVEIALATRLDLMTAQDRRDDATRKVVVAANALKPDLDLFASASVPSEDKDQFLDLDFDQKRWNVGLDVDLPTERTAERNNYRSALINLDRETRDLALQEDTIKLEVRQQWRALDQAKRSFEIQQQAVESAARRVDEQEIRTQAGRATALDLVDAQNDLLNAQNDLTSALVNHTIARLEFWRDMGILYIKEDGQWEEFDNAEQS